MNITRNQFISTNFTNESDRSHSTFERALHDSQASATMSSTLSGMIGSDMNRSVDSLSEIVCNACGFESTFVPEGMLPCLLCHAVHYCSPDCREWDYTSNGHDVVCKLVTKSSTSTGSDGSTLRSVSSTQSSIDVEHVFDATGAKSFSLARKDFRKLEPLKPSTPMRMELKNVDPDCTVGSKSKKTLRVPASAKTAAGKLGNFLNTQAPSNGIAYNSSNRVGMPSHLQMGTEDDEESLEESIDVFDSNSKKNNNNSLPSIEEETDETEITEEETAWRVKPMRATSSESFSEGINARRKQEEDDRLYLSPSRRMAESTSSLSAMGDTNDDDSSCLQLSRGFSIDGSELGEFDGSRGVDMIAEETDEIASDDSMGNVKRTQSILENEENSSNNLSSSSLLKESNLTCGNSPGKTDLRNFRDCYYKGQSAHSKSQALETELASAKQTNVPVNISQFVDRSSSLKEFRSLYNSNQEDMDVLSRHSDGSNDAGSIMLYEKLKSAASVGSKVNSVALDESDDKCRETKCVRSDCDRPTSHDKNGNQAKLVEEASSLQTARMRHETMRNSLNSALRVYEQLYGEDAAKDVFQQLTSSLESANGGCDRIESLPSDLSENVPEKSEDNLVSDDGSLLATGKGSHVVTIASKSTNQRYSYYRERLACDSRNLVPTEAKAKPFNSSKLGERQPSLGEIVDDIAFDEVSNGSRQCDNSVNIQSSSTKDKVSPASSFKAKSYNQYRISLLQHGQQNGLIPFCKSSQSELVESALQSSENVSVHSLEFTSSSEHIDTTASTTVKPYGPTYMQYRASLHQNREQSKVIIPEFEPLEMQNLNFGVSQTAIERTVDPDVKDIKLQPRMAKGKWPKSSRDLEITRTVSAGSLPIPDSDLQVANLSKPQGYREEIDIESGKVIRDQQSEHSFDTKTSKVSRTSMMSYMQFRGKHMLRWSLFAFLLVVVSVAIGASIVGRRHDEILIPSSASQRKSAPTSAPIVSSLQENIFTTPNTTLPEDYTPSLVPSVTEQLFRLIIPVSGDSILVEGTPQYFAFQWLASTPNIFDIYLNERILQRFALATLYHATDGSSWTDNEGWLSEANECTWFMAPTQESNCNANSMYTNVDLGYNDLTGSIPLEISLLTNLESLILHGGPATVLGGTLPIEIGFLKNLKVLDLHRSSLVNSDKLTGPIPIEIGHLSQLTHVSLSGNDFSGSIPTQIGLLTNLVYLDLQSNNLVGPLPEELGNLPKIVTVKLQENDISGAVSESICSGFSDDGTALQLDCLEKSDGTVEIICPFGSCCTSCCSDDAGCNCIYEGTELAFLCY